MATAELPFEGKTVRALVNLNKERAFKFFEGTPFTKDDTAEANSQRVKLACKFRDEYSSTAELPGPAHEPDAAPQGGANGSDGSAAAGTAKAAGAQPAGAAPAGKAPVSKSSMALVISDLSKQQLAKTSEQDAARQARVALAKPRAEVAVAGGGMKEYVPSAAIAKRLASRWPRPEWHAPWKCYRVIAGHLGWVRSIAFDVGNEWFATGSADRTIKLWDTATGALKITLTGHIEQVTGLAISSRHPYMFSCGLDKKVMNWDLEQNKVIRHYHGHLSGVYSLAIHPELDLLMTGGRDSVCRVWDMRSKVQIHCLSGHSATVASILPSATDPQIITGSHDTTIRMWDIRTGKTMDTLTYHKHSVRALASSPHEWAFMAASADNVKKYKLPEGQFAHNMIQNQRAIINAMAINQDGVVATGADNGSLWFWDYLSGNCFQQGQTVAQPGSLESEAGIFAMGFDHSGTRLVTCEADKSIKMWKEDANATPETHPVQFRPPKDIVRRYG